MYIADTLLHDLSGIEVVYTRNMEEFKSFDGAKINYSHHQVAEDEFNIIPASEILFEQQLCEQKINLAENSAYKVLFPSEGSDFSFDIFAASFFLLSRYEEYLPHQKDEYGRFAHNESLAFKASFLKQPVIDYWLYDLQKTLQARFPYLLLL